MITVTLFGQPEVKVDDKAVVFPFKKAEALFYYICIYRKVNRNRALDLFWGEMPEQMARKSLRNAVYVIKKAFDAEILYSPNREFLELSEEVVRTDYHDFKAGCISEIEDYAQEFMENFYVKDAKSFDDWLINMRHQIKEQLIEQLQVEIGKSIACGNLTQADKHCKCLIGLDEFNEEAYRLQMKIYKEMGEHGKCIETFSCLSRILESELSLKPDVQTRELFDSILKERTKKTESKHTEHVIFFGRSKELQVLNDAYIGFKERGDYESILIEGEMGIGKTALVQSFMDTIDHQNICVLKSVDKCIETDLPLAPWQELLTELKRCIRMSQISINDIDRIAIASIFPTFLEQYKLGEHAAQLKRFDLNNLRVVSKAIANVVIEVSKHRPILIVLEDINTFDDLSLSIIRELLFRDRNHRIFMILTMNFIYNKRLEFFVTEMLRKNYIHQISLSRFSYDEVASFIDIYKNFREVADEVASVIFQESEGNPLFMTEIIKAYSQSQKPHVIPSKMRDIFKLKYLTLSDEAKKIVDIASVFKESFRFDALHSISGKDDFDLMTLMDEIIQKDIIVEVCCTADADMFQFVHHKLKEYVYSSLYKAKQRLIHQKIAQYYEGQSTLEYEQIMYHSKIAGDKVRFLKYKIKRIFDFLEMLHEMFPIVKSGDSLISQKNIKSSLKEELEEINALYDELQGNGQFIEPELEIYYLNLMSRYYIITGKGELGLSLTEKMIQLSMESHNVKYILKGYKLMVFHYINTKDVEKMSEVITKAIHLAHKHELKEELGVFIRLKGYGNILKEDYHRGENFLKAAVRLFENLKDPHRYSLNIMACYYYLGESRRLQNQFMEAIEFYHKAVGLSEEYGYIDRLTLFYSSLGQTYFESGDYESARHYLLRAIELYEEFDFQWGKALTWAYMAMLAFQSDDMEHAAYCLERADYYQAFLKSKYEYEKIDTLRNQMIKPHRG